MAIKGIWMLTQFAGWQIEPARIWFQQGGAKGDEGWTRHTGEMKLQDGCPRHKGLHGNPLKELVASLVLGTHREIDWAEGSSLFSDFFSFTSPKSQFSSKGAYVWQKLI